MFGPGKSGSGGGFGHDCSRVTEVSAVGTLDLSDLVTFVVGTVCTDGTRFGRFLGPQVHVSAR